MSKLVTFLSFLLMVSLLVVSCEGYRSAHGTVRDKDTKQLLDSVVCFCVSSDMQVITDTTGYFSVHNPMGGCMPDCRDIIVRFSKNNYKTLQLVNPTDTIIYLEKQ